MDLTEEPRLLTEASPPCTVAGRLVAQSGEQLVLEDAVAALRLRLTRPGALPTLGQLVVAKLVGRQGDCFLAESITVAGAGRLVPHGEHARRLGRALAARAQALRAARGYFDGEGFLEVETPVRVPCPGLDLYVDALPAHEGWLITSPEHHMKRLLVAGARRIYQITRASRAEELGPLHEPEFTLVEWYRAYAGVQAVMADTEQLVRRLVLAVRGASPSSGGAPVRPAGGDARRGAEAHPGEARRGAEAHPGDALVRLADSESALRTFRYQGRAYDLEAPFLRLSVREAFRRFAGEHDLDRLAQDEDRYFDLLVGQVEPALRELSQPVFLHGYPLAQASLARPDPEDPETAERFELYLAGVELCNGFGELNHAAEQRRRYQAALEERRKRGMPVYPLDERFLMALEEGMPPAGGNALGLDRLLMLALDAPELTQVLAFPSARA